MSLDPVAKAADVSVKQTSEHMTMTASITSGTQTVRMTGEGDFQNAPSLGRLTMRVVGSRTLTMREVMRGTTVYLTSDVFRGQLPDGKLWMSLDVGKAMKSLGVDLGSLSSQSPTETLARLRASGHVTELGPQRVGGVGTTHYSAIIDAGKVAKLTKRLGVTFTYAPVDVWVDSKGLVRRMHMAWVQGTSATLPESSMQMTMSLSRYGEPVHVTAPPAALTFDATGLAESALHP